MRGLFTADASVVEDSAQIVLHSCSKELLQQVQVLLLAFGIKSAVQETRKDDLEAILSGRRIHGITASMMHVS